MSFEERTERCPATKDLEALGAGRLGSRDAAAIEEHLNGCEPCCHRLDELGAPFFEELRPAEAVPAGRAGPRPDVLQQAIAQLKSEPRGFKTTSLAAADELATILGTSTGGEPAPGALGPYQVRREVARGAMGIVLEAFDVELLRTVAIKVLAPSLAGVPTFREAFLREARAAAKLQHENVMPIYGVDQQGPLPYLVMPYVEGPTLQHHLEAQAPLAVGEVMTIGHQVSRALEAAHAQDLIHGDIKPANIMLLEGEGDRRVWLADFGLARAAGDQPLLAGWGSGISLAGTPAFMAPEQATGAPVDARADLFALGCVLYAMAGAGRSPFSSGSVQETIDKVCRESPAPLRDAASGVPEWLNRLVGQLLEKDPDRRPQSATAVREAFETHLAPRGISRRAMVGGAVVVASAVALTISRPWEKNLPEGYLVGDSEVLYSTLGAAIEAATSGDTVIVRRTGEIEIESIAIPDGKALTIRAASGFHPIFVSRSWRTAMLRSAAPLCLEGLEFRHPFADNPDEAAPIVHCQSGPVYLANCRFERSTSEPSTSERRRSSGRYDEAKPILHFEDCPHVEVRNCESYTMVGINLALDVSGARFEQELRLENNLMVGQFGVRLEAPPASLHRWKLTRNSILGSVPFAIWTHGKRFPIVEIEYDRNVLDFLRCLLELRELEDESTLPLIRARIELHGTGNLYRRTGLPGKAAHAVYVLRTPAARGDAEELRIETFERFVRAFGPAGRDLDEPVFDWKEIDAYRAKFSLMKAELFELKSPLSAGEEGKGFERAILGPGEGYRFWRESLEYEGWRDQVEKALPK